jgi:ABC-2 type transport system ATP-binding protein
MTAIAAADLRKSYGDTRALDGVSLSVDPGEVFALVGPNGAGKTTLVRCLTGTTTPDAGEARLLGSSPRSAASERIGLLPQEFGPPDRLTASELVAYYAGLYDDSRDVDAVLGEVGLGDAAGTRYADLSGGEKRRTLVATAIVNDPDVLVLDEPTTGIDPAGRRAVHGLIEDLAAAGTTVLLTTHYMDEAERLADRVGVLSGGSLAAVGRPGALVADHGGEPRLFVATDADPVGTDLPGYDAEPTDRGFVIRNVAPTELGAVVDALGKAGVVYDALSWREADLETAYLALTGEAPRESAAVPPSVTGRTTGADGGLAGGGS